MRHTIALTLFVVTIFGILFVYFHRAVRTNRAILGGSGWVAVSSERTDMPTKAADARQKRKEYLSIAYSYAFYNDFLVMFYMDSCIGSGISYNPHRSIIRSIYIYIYIYIVCDSGTTRAISLSLPWI